MGQKSRKNKRKDTKSKSRNTAFWIVAALSVLIVALLVTGKIPLGSPGEKRGKSFFVEGGETRPVLSPALFRGKTLAAYAAAKKYGDVMDQVYCYCYCDAPPFSHKSLRSCFADRHAET
jgi:hypothetical protein